MRLLPVVLLAAACGATDPKVCLTERWPAQPDGYDAVVRRWTRTSVLHANYQEVLELSAVFKSTEWRAARASRDAETRGLVADARDQQLKQAQADATGPYEVELMVTTWDRRENDLDKGKKSVWRVVLIDDAGSEIEPLEIVRDKRPAFTVRAEYPTFGDFATPYIARFPHTRPLLEGGTRQLRLRMTSVRGGVELVWAAGEPATCR
jgi:hypothetical protein